MRVLRLLGWTFAALALLSLGGDIVASLAAGELRFVPLGQTWFQLDVASLNLAQAAVQRYAHPFLWDPLIQTLLEGPGWAPAGVVAAILLWATHVPPRRRYSGLE